jgi:site-specific recombinase XerD
MDGWVWVPRVSGPLAAYAEGFERWLLARGFERSSVGNRLWQLAQLSGWMGREGLDADDLTPDRAEEFLTAYMAAGYVSWSAAPSLRLPFEYLREIGVVPALVPLVVEGPLEDLLRDYRAYQERERGLVEHTIYRHERVARLFLGGLKRPDGRLDVARLTAADVSGFLARECPRRSVSGARDLVFALRPLLRFLHVSGVIAAPLVWAVPGVADVRDRSLPRGLEPQVVTGMLASCDRRGLVGLRDHAILVLLARLGLRAGEVASLQLDDVDWRAGELLVHGKGSRQDVLPLPVDVGDAIVSYLRERGRFDGSRAVFLRVRAPAGALSAGGVISVVAQACVRASVPPVGAHRLRHTAATEMLRAGASLEEIGQVLRHHRIDTTAIYAKVDRGRLRELARPWPEAGAA